MAQIKYLIRKKLGNGRTKWVVNPPKYVKEAIGAYYEQFDDQSDASARAISIADQYSDFKRNVKRDIHIHEDTVAGLVSQYKKTNSWTKLAPNSKRTYNQLLRGVMRLRVGESNKLLQDTMVKHISVKHALKDFFRALRAKIHPKSGVARARPPIRAPSAPRLWRYILLF